MFKMWIGGGNTVVASIEKVFTLLFLAACSISDCKNRRIPVWILVTGGVMGGSIAVCHVIVGADSNITGIIPGILVYLIARLTGQIGVGDAYILLISGMVIGLVDNVMMLMSALLCAVCIAVCLMVIGKKSRKYMIPFVPFLLAGYLVVILRG